MSSFNNSIGGGKGSGPVNTSSVGLSQSGGTSEGANLDTSAKPAGWGGIPPQNSPGAQPMETAQSGAGGGSSAPKTSVTTSHGKGGKTTGKDR
jgi:hypothetical protein